MKFNDTGAAVKETLTIDGISGSIDVANGVTSVSVTKLVVTIDEFVTLGGNYAFKRTVDGDIQAWMSPSTVRLNA